MSIFAWLRLKFFGVFLVSLALLSSCQKARESQERVRAWMHESEKIKILATTQQVGFLVEKVGGEDIHLLVLVGEGQDPHSYQLVKGDDDLFRIADIVFSSGLFLEHSPSLSHQLKKKGAIPIADRITRLDPSALIMQGPMPDPHMWLDVSLWKQGLRVVAEELSRYLPKKRALFERRAAQAEKELETFHEEIFSALQSIPERQRYLVTTHDAFHYFSRAYLASKEEREQGTWAKRTIAPEGLAPESQISSQELQEVISFLKEHHLSTIFPEVGMNEDSIKKIIDVCGKKGLSIRMGDPLYSDSMPGEGEESYEKMIRENVQSIFQGLREERK